MNLHNIRNIGIIAHIDAGKTTTTERMLFYSGKIQKMGEVDEGTATMDWMIQEKERGITITSAVTTIQWKCATINIIDTPGHVDFTIEVERALKVLDGAIVIFDAVNGVEPQSETVWHQADKFSLPRIVFLNKLDRIGADFFGTISDMEKKLGITPLVLQLPYGYEKEFKGVVDLVRNKTIIWKNELGKVYEEHDIPSDLNEIAKFYKDKMIEMIAEIDESVFEMILKDDNSASNKLLQLIRTGVIRNKFYPVLCGSALKNKGIQPLLDAVVNFLPSPADRPEYPVFNAETNKKETISLHSDFSAFVFKIQMDSYLGKVAYSRVFSGEISAGKTVYNPRKNKRERITKIFHLHADKKQEIKTATAGDIVAFIGLISATTGDTLTDLKKSFLFEPLKFPEPVMWARIEPKTKADEEKFDHSLNRILEEDPTLKLKYDQETGQYLLYGMGELHLEVITDILKTNYKINVNLSKPQVSYKETITSEAVSEGNFCKVISGKTHSASLTLKLYPNPNKGIEFIDSQTSIPNEYISAIKEGIMNALTTGVLFGYPVTDVVITLCDGIYDPNTSSDLAYRAVAAYCINDALKKANPVLLEPIMKLEIFLPEEYLGSVISDLNTRRAKINNIEIKQNNRIISGYVPLAEMFGYATTLRSLTQGRAFFMLEPAHYEIATKPSTG